MFQPSWCRVKWPICSRYGTFTYIYHEFNLSQKLYVYIHMIYIYRQIFQFLWDIWMGFSMGRSLLRFWHSWLFSVSWPLVGSCWIHGWKRGNLRASLSAMWQFPWKWQEVSTNRWACTLLQAHIPSVLLCFFSHIFFSSHMFSCWSHLNIFPESQPFPLAISAIRLPWGMFALNFISIELENPFGLDANDLPLAHFQPPGSLIGKVNQEFFLVVVSTNGTCSVKVGCK